jgi:hypothetical protein
LLPTTPKPKAEWLRKLIELGNQDSETGIESFEFPAGSNPTYDWGRYAKEERKAEMRARETLGPKATAADDPFFAEQFLGQWVYYTGRALPFNQMRHVIPPLIVEDLEGIDIGVSVDYGYEDPASAGLWAIMPSRQLIRFDEVYERHLSTPAFVERIQEKLGQWGVFPKYATGDPSRPEVSRLMSEAGFPVVEMDKGAQRDRAAGHRRIADLLTEGEIEGEPGLLVTSNCTHTITEWKLLHYKEGYRDEYGTTALKGADHTFDDTRYFVMSRPGPSRQRPEEHWFKQWKRERARAQRRAAGGLHPLMGTSAWATTGKSPYAS